MTTRKTTPTARQHARLLARVDAMTVADRTEKLTIAGRLTDAGFELVGELTIGGVWSSPENAAAVAEALEEFEEAGMAEYRQVPTLVTMGAVIAR